MARITFKIPSEKQAQATQALKSALPKLKNASKCISVGEFNIPDTMADKVVEALRPYATDVTVSASDAIDAQEDVQAAFARLEKAFDKLEERAAVRSDRLTAKLVNAAADFLEKL